MIICEVGNGNSARFWHNNWTSHGPLIDLTGPRGPEVTGLHVDAVVAEALRDGNWWLSRSRSRNRLITMIRDSLPDANPISSSEVDDIYLWKPGNRVASISFSTADTWDARRASFQVPPTCILCNKAAETRKHPFFDCSYSSEVWVFFCSRLSINPPVLFEDGLRWLRNPSPEEFVKLIVKLVYQAALYSIWKERNARIHNQISHPAQAVILEMKQTVQARLDPLSRAHNSRRTDITLLGTWFSFF
ncbi:uncharacterized protein LOC125591863 [Brassica napus]|uniref:uncharacterized protein LOC125591863 n=1 Tax=Brassica napus TaxID=3708 RepID=UPI00207A22E7|nr:uncharacterized protein LOC125591863 [Brassica napus]